MNYKWKDTKRNHESEPWRGPDENDKADPTLKHELWRGTSSIQPHSPDAFTPDRDRTFPISLTVCLDPRTGLNVMAERFFPLPGIDVKKSKWC